MFIIDETEPGWALIPFRWIDKAQFEEWPDVPPEYGIEGQFGEWKCSLTTNYHQARIEAADPLYASGYIFLPGDGPRPDLWWATSLLSMRMTYGVNPAPIPGWDGQHLFYLRTPEFGGHGDDLTPGIGVSAPDDISGRLVQMARIPCSTSGYPLDFPDLSFDWILDDGLIPGSADPENEVWEDASISARVCGLSNYTGYIGPGNNTYLLNVYDTGGHPPCLPELSNADVGGPGLTFPYYAATEEL